MSNTDGTERGRIRLLVPPRLRGFPGDLAAVLVLTVLVDIVLFLPGLRTSPLRTALAFPWLVFCPGYALVSALFPTGAPNDPDDDRSPPSDTRVGTVERFAFSIVLSIAIVPLLGLSLYVTSVGLGLWPAVLTISGFVVCCIAIAAYRRAVLPADEQFRLPFTRWGQAVWTEFVRADETVDRVLNGALIVTVVLAAGLLMYSAGFSSPTEPTTELYLLTETGDGELVADNYTDGDSGTHRFVVGVDNHENVRQEYTLVLKVQQLPSDRNRTGVVGERVVDRVSTPALADNETWHRRTTVDPDERSGRTRVLFLLYKGEAPSSPTVETAYREAHVLLGPSGEN